MSPGHNLFLPFRGAHPKTDVVVAYERSVVAADGAPHVPLIADERAAPQHSILFALRAVICWRVVVVPRLRMAPFPHITSHVEHAVGTHPVWKDSNGAGFVDVR